MKSKIIWLAIIIYISKVNKYDIDLDDITVLNDIEMLNKRGIKESYTRDELIDIFTEIYTSKNINEVKEIWRKYINKELTNEDKNVKLGDKMTANFILIYKFIRRYFYTLKIKIFNEEEILAHLSNNQLNNFLQNNISKEADEIATDYIKNNKDKLKSDL